MTDRELLEMAAKAAEHKYPHYDEPSGLWYANETLEDGGVYWNPLYYDADALRLAVKLRLGIEWWKGGVNEEKTERPLVPTKIFMPIYPHETTEEYAARFEKVKQLLAKEGLVITGEME